MAEIKWICGLPWEEAQWVLELYKYKKEVPSGDYADGFRAGVEYSQSLFEEQLHKTLEDIFNG